MVSAASAQSQGCPKAASAGMDWTPAKSTQLDWASQATAQWQGMPQ